MNLRSKSKKLKADSPSVRLADMVRLFHRLRVNPWHFTIPAALAMGASIFEGASVGLLVPLVKGMIQADYSFVKQLPFFGTIMSALPQLFENRSAVFIFLISTVLLSAVLKLVFQYASVLSSAHLVRKFTDHLRREIFGRYLSFGKAYFDRTSTGYLYEIMATFTQKIGAGLLEFRNFLSWFFMLVIYVALLFYLSWKLTLIALILFPVLRLSVGWILRKMERTSRDYAQAQKELGKDMFNAISCILLVKANSMEEKERNRFASSSLRVRQLELSIDKKSNLIQPLQEIISLTALLLLVSFTAFFIIRAGDGTSAANYLIYFFALRRSMIAFAILNQIKGAASAVEGPLADVINVLEKSEDKFLIPEGHVEFTTLKQGIEFRNVTFAYSPDRLVLRNLNLKIEKGKMTALAGETGAGKSTLVHLILRFYDVASETIFIDGCDIRSFTFQSLLSKIAMVTQEVYLLNGSLRMNLIYGTGKEVSKDELAAAIKVARLEEFIEKLPQGLETSVGDRGIQLSGGEKQRVSIARALLKDPEILILDEATSSLDSHTEKLVQQAIEVLIQGRTTIMIAHRLSTIQRADQIIILENGQAVEYGSFEDLLRKRGKFYSYWQEQKAG